MSALGILQAIVLWVAALVCGMLAIGAAMVAEEEDDAREFRAAVGMMLLALLLAHFA